MLINDERVRVFNVRVIVRMTMRLRPFGSTMVMLMMRSMPVQMQVILRRMLVLHRHRTCSRPN